HGLASSSLAILGGFFGSNHLLHDLVILRKLATRRDHAVSGDFFAITVVGDFLNFRTSRRNLDAFDDLAEFITRSRVISPSEHRRCLGLTGGCLGLMSARHLCRLA